MSVLSTWLVTGILLWEAINRIRNPVEVNGKSRPLPLSASNNMQTKSQGLLAHSASHLAKTSRMWCLQRNAGLMVLRMQ